MEGDEKEMPVNEKEEKVYQFLENLDIPYTRHEHPPVYTVEEAKKYWESIEGAHCKNLFLRNNKGNRHFLVILEESKTADLNEIAQKLGTGKLSFASARRLEQYLGLESGAVSPFGLINDKEKQVDIVLDKDLKKKEMINFHPNVNTSTITLSFKDFERFLEACGNNVIYID